jgi:DNA-directed RNA polymerase specialized sigma24 family protein
LLNEDGKLISKDEDENVGRRLVSGGAAQYCGKRTIRLRPRLIACPFRRIANQERSAIVFWHLRRMPPRMRNVLMLRHWRSLTFAEIGLALRMSEKSATRLYVRAVFLMRERLLVTRIASTKAI